MTVSLTPMAGQGYRELETGPAAKSLVRGYSGVLNCEGIGQGHLDPWVPLDTDHLLWVSSDFHRFPSSYLGHPYVDLKVLSLGTREWIFQNKYPKIKCLHELLYRSTVVCIHSLFSIHGYWVLSKHPECWVFSLSFTLHCLSKYGWEAESRGRPTMYFLTYAPVFHLPVNVSEFLF